MKEISKDACIGVLGAGTMGSGIAQLAAQCGHKVLLFDANSGATKQAVEKIGKSLDGLVQKGKINEQATTDIVSRILPASSLSEFKDCGLIIEAVIEDINVKQELFKTIEQYTSPDCIFATNTSSLSVTSIASGCKDASKVIGIHFFNPAQIIPLVEIVPGIATNAD